MCGRYHVLTEAENMEMREIFAELNRRYGYADDDAVCKTGEIFPTDCVPVQVYGKRERGIATGLMRWGFPRWNGKGVIINARAESAMEKPMFRQAMLQRRCVIPTSGFYEWMHEGKKATGKHMFRLPDTDMLYLAGCYNLFAENETEKSSPRFVILTTAANESIAMFHDRMPVLLRPEEREIWLRDSDAASAILARIPPQLVSYSA